LTRARKMSTVELEKGLLREKRTGSLAKDKNDNAWGGGGARGSSREEGEDKKEAKEMSQS